MNTGISAFKSMIFLLIYDTNQDSHFLLILIVINSEENEKTHIANDKYRVV